MPNLLLVPLPVVFAPLSFTRSPLVVALNLPLRTVDNTSTLKGQKAQRQVPNPAQQVLTPGQRHAQQAAELAKNIEKHGHHVRTPRYDQPFSSHKDAEERLRPYGLLTATKARPVPLRTLQEPRTQFMFRANVFLVFALEIATCSSINNLSSS